ncbi:PIN domain-containing protein [Promineifilum sp.]|uniref:PIN domain-containing protein n=1 Tax=Promineifilum sp. TaxID=2664178 RepID=UPI0035B2E002
MSAVDEPDLFFLDTNVLIYVFDQTAPAKQVIAERLVREALNSGHGTISAQVVQEFLYAALRKFERPMTIPECREHLRTVLQPLCRYFPAPSSYDRALLIVQETGYSLYDALIVTAALESGCRTLLTEDLQHGRVVQGVTIVNPFAET